MLLNNKRLRIDDGKSLVVVLDGLSVKIKKKIIQKQKFYLFLPKARTFI